MTTFKRLTILGLVLLLPLLGGDALRTVHSDGCGLEPLKPLVPLGCKDLKLQCTCDSKGKNCHWEWICVK